MHVLCLARFGVVSSRMVQHKRRNNEELRFNMTLQMTLAETGAGAKTRLPGVK